MLDEFHRHEALDRCSLLVDVISVHLLDHAYIQAHPEYAKKIEESARILFEVYQSIGSEYADTNTRRNG